MLAIYHNRDNCGHPPDEVDAYRQQTVVFEEINDMGIKLHYHPLSTYSRRVLIAFAEKQIPHELIVVDMAARRHREQPYLSLNPYGRVPTLEEDGFVLYESTAILNYLESTRPNPPLVPADARGRALVDMHM